MTLMLVLSVFAAISSPAGAQGDGNDTPVDQTEQPADTGEGDQPSDDEQSPDTGDQQQNGSDQGTDQQVQPLQVDPSSITVNYMACPTGTDLVNTDGATLNAICTASGPATDFVLSTTNAVIGSQNATAPASIAFADVPAETILLSQNPAPTVFAVFCQGNTSYGNTKPYARALIASPVVTLDVLEGETIVCDWFVEEAAPAATGSLTLYKWFCPPDADPTVDPGECDVEMAGVPFTLVDGNGSTPFTSDTNGRQLDNIVADANGVFTIAEQMLPGYLAPAVYCQNNAEDPQPNAPELVPVTNGAITIDPSTPDFEYQCFWYNVPDPNPSDITIRKWQCPVGYNVTAPGADPKVDCTQPVDGVTYVLSDTDPATVDLQTDTGDSMPGAVYFGGTAPGEVTVTETLPPGTTQAFLWGCDGGVFFGNAVATNTAVAYTMLVPGGQTITCDWYNVPSVMSGTVTLYKWQCPAGTDATSQDPAYFSAQCATEQPGIDFTLTDANGITPFKSDTNGKQLNDVEPDANGLFTLTEMIPAGYGTPAVFCQNNGEDPQPNAPTRVLSTGGIVAIQPSTSAFEYQCFWYNLPGGTSSDTGMLHFLKWGCPVGSDPLLDTSGCNPMPGVNFTVVDDAGSRTFTTGTSPVTLSGIVLDANGSFTITEQLPAGYADPVGYCSPDQATSSQQAGLATIPGGTLTVSPATLPFDYYCEWFNVPLTPGEVTVYKWTCPEGYDWTAWSANPKNDCTTATNGITFVLDQPVGVDLQTDTGDSIDGAVYFGGLEPGDYVLNEIVPDGISDVFVLDCVGLNTGSVHPVPLSVGPTLPMRIVGGDRIRCDWYNVPAPQLGWLTVTKYTCSTQKYVTDIDCEIFEGGKAFELQMWNGTMWTKVASGTTNVAGQVTWSNLAPGTYRAVEQGGTACKVIATPADAQGNAVVNAKAGTMVKVYNCGITPSPESKMPTKYPNTGVDPSASTRVMPGASIIGALGLTGATMTRRSFLRRSAAVAGTLGIGAVAVREGLAGQVIEPDGTPMATPGAGCLYPATPEAATAIAGTPVVCARGAVPVHIAIETIDVDADIEVLEIVAGEMQQPTGATDVAWYKETARLGERGNILLAGHLNFWGVPEGVFFALGQLEEGDVVELTGDDTQIYRYIVQWTRAFPSDEEPPAEALGQTEEQAITMITCGGEWVTDRSEYDHRTVVRAIRDSEYVPSSTPVV